MGMNPRTLRPGSAFTPRSISGLALWLDAADTQSLYTTDAGPVTAVSAPTEISGCVLWLDGADNATITASGGLVSQWTDKSASGAVLQASGSARPTLSSTGFNSRQAVVFNGTSTNMASASPYTATNGLSGMTRIAVCQNANALGVAVRVFSGGSDMFINMNGSWRSAVDSTSGTNFVSSTTFSIASALPAGVYADLFSSSSITQYGFGAAATTTVTGTIPSTTGTGTPTLHVGSNIGANFFWNGPIAEVIYFNRALTRAELTRVEAYLAAKWGIAGVHAQATATSDPVGYWRDKSGNNRHATQATVASRPTVSANTQNSKRMLAFDGTNGKLNIAHPVAQNDPVSMIAVARRGSTTWGGGGSGGYGSIINSSNGTSAGPQLRVDTGNIEVIGGSNRSSISGSLVGVGSCAIITGTVTNRDTALYVQGALVDADAGAGAISTGGTTTAIGAWNPATQGGGPLQGDVAELIVYRASLSAAQRQSIHRYLASKWGIVLAPQVSNADAQDWVNRVYANGGTVSSTTATAVNTFCNAIDAAGLRDRFYRLNLFCGTGLAACLVPLYRGPSLGGAQYGSSTDTNNGPFVSGDYAEDNGLLGNASSKYLNTGFNANTAGLTTDSVHMSAVWPTYTQPANSNYQPVSITNSSANERFWIVAFANTVPITAIDSYLGQSGTNFVRDTLAGTNSATVPGGLWVSSRTSVSSLRLYNGSTQRAELTSPVSSSALPTTAMTVFVRWDGTNFFGYSGQRLRAYSVGLGMTAAQVASFNTAMTTLQSALGRA